MTSNLIPEQPIASSEIRYDDLTLIKGIKESRQQWLRETLHVRTYSDLARLSVADVMSALPDGQIVSRRQIETWIRHAKQLSAAETPAVAFPKAEKGWHPFASFVIEFQQQDGQPEEKRTKVHYMESDRSMMWPGIETDTLCSWIADQLDASRRPEFSDKLQRVLAKIELLQERSPMKESILPAAEIEPTTETGFSAKLQEVIAKSQRLSQ